MPQHPNEDRSRLTSLCFFSSASVNYDVNIVTVTFFHLELIWLEIFTYFFRFVSEILTSKSTLKPKSGMWRIYVVYCSLIISVLSGKLLAPIPYLKINPSRTTCLSLSPTVLMMPSSGLCCNFGHTSDITDTIFCLRCLHVLDCDSHKDRY